MDVLGYVRVLTGTQRLNRQIAELESETARRSWALVDVVRDPARSAATLQRPALLQALKRLDRGDAEVLVVCDLDRLTRDVVDMGDLLNWFDEAGVRLVSLAQQLDTALPGARAVAQVWASFAQLEREKGAHATKMGMQERRAVGACIGRPAVVDQPSLRERIERMRFEENKSLREICQELNAAGVPTVRGAAAWKPSALQTVLGYKRPATRRQRDVLPPVSYRRTVGSGMPAV